MFDRIGALAQEARKGRNYTHTDVRKLLGWDKSRLSRIEKGRQNPSLVDFLQLGVLFSHEFQIKTSQFMEEIKADIYARLCDLLEAEDDVVNPSSFKRIDNLKALKLDLEALHGAA
ncbi:MAG: helix-turn-helix transcriptional regulator [Pseudomonadota bacterium]